MRTLDSDGLVVGHGDRRQRALLQLRPTIQDHIHLLVHHNGGGEIGKRAISIEMDVLVDVDHGAVHALDIWDSDNGKRVRASRQTSCGVERKEMRMEDAVRPQSLGLVQMEAIRGGIGDGDLLDCHRGVVHVVLCDVGVADVDPELRD